MGPLELKLSDVVERGMIPVIRKREIVRARALSRAEKKAEYAGDILITEPSGRKRMITRQELLKTYTYLNGKKISLSGWKSDKHYIIGRLDNTNAFAMMVPLNCTANVNGTMVNQSNRKSADYIVALASSNGGIDTSTIGIIPSALFKKMYYIPPNEIITRNKGLGHKLFIGGPGGVDEREGRRTPGSYRQQVSMGARQPQPRQVQLRQTLAKTPRPADMGGTGSMGGQSKETPQFTSELNIDTSNIDFGVTQAYGDTRARPTQPQAQRLMQGQGQGAWSKRKMSDYSKTPSTQTQPQPGQVQRQPASYLAIGRLVDQSGTVVGFVIQNGKGQTKKVTLSEMKELCGRHLVSNIMIALNPANNSYYLRGNNIRIETLTAYPI